jgi:hypothetical protein
MTESAPDSAPERAPDTVGPGAGSLPGNPEEGGVPPNGPGDATSGGATATEEGAPLGFGATVGGSPPGTTDDAEEAAEFGNGPAQGPPDGPP